MAEDKNKQLEGKGETPAAEAVKAPVAEKPKSKLKEAPKPEEGTVVAMAKLDSNGGKTSNYIWIEGTGAIKHLPKGKKFEVQELHGKKLVDKGAAILTTAPPKVQPKPVGKKNKDEDEEDD